MENKKVTLQELADVISAQSGTTKRFTDSFLRELVLVIQEYLEKDGVVKVKGLGTFKLLWIEARKSVNVATKETIILPAHYKLSFTAEEGVRQELNSQTVILGGASVLEESENEPEPIEEEIEVPTQLVEVTLQEENTIEEELSEEDNISPEVEAESRSVSEQKEIKEVEVPTKKTNKGLVSIIVILTIIILCLCAYIFIPNIEGKLMGLFKPELKESNLEVIAPKDSTILKPDTLVVSEPIVEKPVEEPILNEPVVEEPVKDELPAEPVITVDNYTSSVAKNAPTREIVTVIDGSRLTMVAYRAYGHKAFWVYVYDANRDKLKSPSAVEKGMQLRIADLPLSLVNSKDRRCLDKAYELATQYDK